MMHINNKIKEIREKNKLNQSQFGEKLDVSQKVVSNIESGKNEPTLLLLQKIISVFNISPIWLINEQEVSFDKKTNNLDLLYIKARNFYLDNQNDSDLENYLNEYITLNDAINNEIINKLRTIKGKDFISKISEFWSAKGERMLMVFYYFLKDLKKGDLSLDNDIKNNFIKILSNFNPPSRFAIITQKDKNELIKWCEQNLEDVEILDILKSTSNVEKVISEIKKELNIFNKFTV